MTNTKYQGELPELTLGKQTDYPTEYDASLLQPVSRSINRDDLGLGNKLPFTGEDLWNGYEFSWLNPKGKPINALLQCHVPAESPNIIESKSFKLYLNGFYQSVFESEQQVRAILTRDLSICAGQEVKVTLSSLTSGSQFDLVNLDARCIDDLDVSIEHYEPNKHVLQFQKDTVEETLCSHLLKSNCLITNQPDWGTVIIKYQGPKIVPESLLKYIVSFRLHNEFHEQCVERIFCDILEKGRPGKLTVMARYTRRGGLDINPFRSNFEDPYVNMRLIRQ